MWTAAANLAGGHPVHYICDEKADWMPDLDDIESKITDRTKGIVIINPNNPTGALYPKDLLERIVEIARRHELIIFADEIYDRLVMDGEEHGIHRFSGSGYAVPDLQWFVEVAPHRRLPPAAGYP